eukprot:11039-Heterococcus_DN1.PRE.2
MLPPCPKSAQANERSRGAVSAFAEKTAIRAVRGYSERLVLNSLLLTSTKVANVIVWSSKRCCQECWSERECKLVVR